MEEEAEMNDAKRVALLESALMDMIAIAEHCAPSPAHEGSCGPWSSCDGQCVDAANCAQMIRSARSLLNKDTK